jgi:hypothetical protein
MAYSATNPPSLLVPSIGNKPGLWAYSSTHTSTEILASGFFANGSGLGMKPNDILITVSSTGFIPFVAAVSTVNASSAATVVGSSAA